MTTTRLNHRVHIQRGLRLVVTCLVMLVEYGVSQSISYYLDSFGGNDAFDGKSRITAWQSFANINTREFQAGDTIYLRAGSIWTDHLSLHGSGTKAHPIVVDVYDGTLKPRIDGNGINGSATVYLYNSTCWEINNLEITNDGQTAADRRGVLVTASNFGLVEHIYLKNLDIHNVKGIVGSGNDAKRTGGIGVETAADDLVATRYDDVLIDGCSIGYAENTGIYTDNMISRSDPAAADFQKRKFTNVRIRNNVIHHIAKNAMIIRLLEGGVIEHNVCYETALGIQGNTMFTSSCYGTVFQYNEGYTNRAAVSSPGGGDGSMYDADSKSYNIVFQYSYSHDNSHGLLWNATNQTDSAIICRYNISRNDRGIIFCVNYPINSVYIYNNTVYIGPDLAPVIISERNTGTGVRTYTFKNNIIYNMSDSATYNFRTSGYNRTIDYNVFYGKHPATEPPDLHKLVLDPKLVDPASGGIGIDTLDGFKLQQGSPCINSGVALPGHCSEDFWGNTVPSGGQIDRGAFEYPMGTGAIDNKRANLMQWNLNQNYPNPFNPTTQIEYNLPTRERVALKIFDLLGHEIATLVEATQDAGYYRIPLDGSRWASGVYFYRLVTGSFSSTKKLLLLR
ncbi:MAG: T9SS type A sorting domain-containing protein [Bacteroidota bacterium]